ncbi:hypothetical protein RHGRI_011970 [Rhododendron griersonianum]|uniref:2-isopropylmalate synthase n=1 Tax=Rhododendron griersonianum TaxID=479676 RepID=A0AAV6KPB8_9ERIC|nr:hypothetical protein RHGRI_011970 [Rhododendron griersonianum]
MASLFTNNHGFIPTFQLTTTNSVRRLLYYTTTTKTPTNIRPTKSSTPFNACSATRHSSRGRPAYIPNRIPDPKYVRVFDTTLRDGEQSPGASMTSKEKLDVARQLARLGVDVIEAGFPAASNDDLEAVKMIAKEVGSVVDENGHVPVICGMARCNKGDIDALWEAVRHAKRPRILTFIATSEIHMRHKLKKSKEEVIETARSIVRYARSLGCDDVEFGAEDAGRSDREFLYQIFAEVIKAGATTLGIGDTTGFNTPDEFGQLIAGIRANTSGIENVIISTHCHNDLGLATANTLAGACAGARQVEVTINGIGERAGNASLEEVSVCVAHDIRIVRANATFARHDFSLVLYYTCTSVNLLNFMEAYRYIVSGRSRKLLNHRFIALADILNFNCSRWIIGETSFYVSQPHILQVVMALKCRGDHVLGGLYTGINTEQIISSSKMVEEISGLHVQPHKAIVGANAFAHESGIIHQDGMIKHENTYETISPEDIGLRWSNESSVVLGKLSGRHALRSRLSEVGCNIMFFKVKLEFLSSMPGIYSSALLPQLAYDIDSKDLDDLFWRFKAVAEKKKNITDDDLKALVSDVTFQPQVVWKLGDVQVTCGTLDLPMATVRLIDANGGEHIACANGTGPVDSAYKAIDHIVKEHVILLEYSMDAVTEGIDAIATTRVLIRGENNHTSTHSSGETSHRTFSGTGAGMDIVVSSVRAYVNALNKMLSFHNQTEATVRAIVPEYSLNAVTEGKALIDAIATPRVLIRGEYNHISTHSSGETFHYTFRCDDYLNVVLSNAAFLTVYSMNPCAWVNIA